MSHDPYDELLSEITSATSEVLASVAPDLSNDLAALMSTTQSNDILAARIAAALVPLVQQWADRWGVRPEPRWPQ